MVLEFSYNKQEVINALRYHFWQRGEIKVFRYTGLILAVFSAVGFILGFVNVQALTAVMAVVTLMYACFFFLLPISTYNRASTFKENIRLRWNEQGILINTFSGERLLPWKQFKQVVETRTFFYLYKDSKSFFLVPTNAFSSEAERQAFSLLLQQLYKNYRLA
ncbi:hypothetical protein COR50_06960 [Chitinophaga caeni]|uniref:YcxB-like C-terminal domain-containing protein n=1 Tax=Chitinophaga caeni TaxID=2029983 RepID=A0A291QST9_9BACT|nr:YcxB family protein [Chitinophaga caeni]ATL46942.1 hypothetical protein COR50_06960 [Chitinophaga caeni]